MTNLKNDRLRCKDALRRGRGGHLGKQECLSLEDGWIFDIRKRTPFFPELQKGAMWLGGALALQAFFVTYRNKFRRSYQNSVL